MCKLAIIVVTFNRIHCLKRLLKALELAEYHNDYVDLIISVDKSEVQSVENYAKEFVWSHGQKFVKTHVVNLGLRNHILECGNFVNDYDAIAMFEDDIIPSSYFYTYFKQAVEFYGDNDQIGGISLYKHLWNVGDYSYFEPEIDPNFDNYLMQYAQSWGQIWTKRMWNDFYNWYLAQDGIYNSTNNVPKNVNNWPKTSWLKYNIKYLVETNKYFVYPYLALSTNCGDAGVHNSASPNYQVPLLNKEIKQYRFCDQTNCNVIYDAFFERKQIADSLGLNNEDICIDLYSLKNNTYNKKYWITTKQLDYKIMKSYSLALKPIEMNVFMDFSGYDIFLYDTAVKVKNNFKDKKSIIRYNKVVYSSKDIHNNDLLLLTFYNFKKALKRKLKK